MLTRAKCLLFALVTASVTGIYGQSTNSFIVEIEAGENLGQIIAKINARNQIFIAYPSFLADEKPLTLGHIKAPSMEAFINSTFSPEFEMLRMDDNKYLLRTQNEILATNAISISGQLLNELHEPVPDVLISNHRSLLAISDSNGLYTIEIADGNEDIFFSGIGYKSRSTSAKALISSPNFVLTSAPIYLETVTIVDKLPSRLINNLELAQNLHFSNSNKILSPRPGQDLLRAIQMQAGINADDDYNSGIKIRGSNEGESLIMADHIPIYKTDHFYGIFGAINGDYFKSASLYKNALPIEVGGKTGGLLEISSSSNIQKPQIEIYSDILLSSLVASAPLSPNSSLQLGARSSYPKASTPLQINLPTIDLSNLRDLPTPTASNTLISAQPDFWFYDINAQWKLQLEKWNIELNAFTSKDDLANDYSMNFIVRGITTNRHQQEFINQNRWENRGLSIYANYDINKNTKITYHGYISAFSETDSIFSNYNITRLNNQLNRFAISNFQANRVTTVAQKIIARQQKSSGYLKRGFEYKYHQLQHGISEDDRNIQFKNNNHSEITGFIERQWKWDQHSLTLGSRMTYYSGSNRIYLDPKCQYLWKPSNYLSIKSSVHYAHQYIRELNYENRLSQTNQILVLATQAIPVGTSFQIMTGATWFRNEWKIDLELYRKTLGSTLEFSLLMPGFNAQQPSGSNRGYALFVGSGDVRGMDLTIEKKWGNFDLGVAYTLSKSTRKLSKHSEEYDLYSRR